MCGVAGMRKLRGVAEYSKPVELPGLSVRVDRVVYMENAQTPPDLPYCFVYYITIRNRSQNEVTIRGRKWIVRDGSGEVNVLEGDGVVGQKPRLAPGEEFSYDSYHLLKTPRGVAEGSYLGIDDQGRAVVTRIPKFEMEVTS